MRKKKLDITVPMPATISASATTVGRRRKTCSGTKGSAVRDSTTANAVSPMIVTASRPSVWVEPQPASGASTSA